MSGFELLVCFCEILCMCVRTCGLLVVCCAVLLHCSAVCNTVLQCAAVGCVLCGNFSSVQVSQGTIPAACRVATLTTAGLDGNRGFVGATMRLTVTYDPPCPTTPHSFILKRSLQDCTASWAAACPSCRYACTCCSHPACSRMTLYSCDSIRQFGTIW